MDWDAMTLGVSPSSSNTKKSPQKCICKSAHYIAASLCVHKVGFVVGSIISLF